MQIRFGIPLELMEDIKTGTLTVLAVTAAARSELLPDIPTVGEFVPGYERIFWDRRSTHPRRSSISSTVKSTRCSPIQGSMSPGTRPDIGTS